MSGGNSTGIVNQSLFAAIGATYQTDGCEKKKKTNKTWSDIAVYQPFEVLMICFAGSDNRRKKLRKLSMTRYSYIYGPSNSVIM